MQPPKHQYSLDLIEHRVEAAVVQQRLSDGYINATALATAAGKRWYNYKRTEETGNFLRTLAAKSAMRETDLIRELRDDDGVVSTWVHPKVAIHFGQWLSPHFAVQVTEWVYEWMSGGQQRRSTTLPPHLQRHMLNASKVPPTHFSILQEMTNMLIAPLEMQGYSLPDRLVPDISQGRMFCRFLREELGLDTDALPTYEHEYPDGRRMPAKLYPVEHLSRFRVFINEVWFPERAAAYFAERDPSALPFLDKVLRITYKPASPPKLAKPRRKPTPTH